MPFRLDPRQHIDFTGDFTSALARLRGHLHWLISPEGILHALRDRLADAERDLRRASDEDRPRIQDDIAELGQQIQVQQRAVADPQAAAQRAAQSIERGLERARQPERPVGALNRSKFVNAPPGVAPKYFQDRHVETGLIAAFLRDDASRLMTVVGRGGIGKTAMICRLLKALENGRLPDDGGPLSVDGIVYLSASGSRSVSLPNLYADLSKLLPEDSARELEALYRNPQTSTENKLRALLQAFPDGRVVALLDNFEDLIEPESQNLRDSELDEALRALLKLPHHGVKVIITTRMAPRALALEQPGRQTRLDLDKGLESPHAENILRAMDADGKVGLKHAPPELLNKARERTRGYPRALEALFAILSADRYTTLQEVLDSAEGLLPENVVVALVGEAFMRLDPTAQRVMQALAIYNRPVPATAVDYLLQPHVPGVNSAPVLNRLVNMQFVRKETGRFYLHPIDRAYAFGCIPPGQTDHRLNDDNRPFTQISLLHSAAEYFAQVRLPREDWKQLEDLAPQLAEFDLRCAVSDYETAGRVLFEIDFGYLQLWGHFRLAVELHERVRGKLDDPELKQNCAGNLGSAYYRLGQLHQAIACYEDALDHARQTEGRSDDATWLGNLANCYGDMGNMSRAIEFYEEALAICRDVGDRAGEASNLGRLATCYSDLGQTRKAVDHHNQALAIVQEDRASQALELCNLAGCYAELGQVSRALETCEQALGIAQDIAYRVIESAVLSYKADALVDLGQPDRAIRIYEQAIQVADDTGFVQLQNEARTGLALAHLLSNELAAARAAVERAQEFDFALNNHRIRLLRGIVALREGDRQTAQQAFSAAITEANRLLAHGDSLFRAFDSKAAALCGLALCEDKRHLDVAVETFRAARRVNQEVGVVERALRLLDVMKPVDPGNVLDRVRTAAGKRLND